MRFDPNFFQRRRFTTAEIKALSHSAKKDLTTAKKYDSAEVAFTFSYQAFLKLGITVIAKHGYKAKSREGHHIAIIEKLAEIDGNQEIRLIGEAMRRKRNIDLYAGGTVVSEKEAFEYRDFVGKLINKYLKT